MRLRVKRAVPIFLEPMELKESNDRLGKDTKDYRHFLTNMQQDIFQLNQTIKYLTQIRDELQENLDAEVEP